MTPTKIVDKGNRFAVRFFIAVLLAHFVVVAPTFDPPPKIHAVVGDAKDQIRALKSESVRYRKFKQNMADIRRQALFASMPRQSSNSRAPIASPPNQSELLKEAQRLADEESKASGEHQAEIENELKMDEKVLEFEKLKTPRQFSVPGVTTINTNDILKLYPAVICLGLLQLLEYRRKLILGRAPSGNWPVWAAPIPLTNLGPLWRTALLNSTWMILLGLLYFMCSDVARREEFYSNPKLLAVNIPLGALVMGWYVSAFARNIMLSFRRGR